MSLKSICVITSVSSLISLLNFCLADLSSGENGELTSSTISVWGLMCYLSFCCVSYIWGALIFGAMMFNTEISSWWIFPVTNMKCPSLSLLIDFSLESVLLDIRIAIPACFSRPIWLEKILLNPLLWSNVCLWCWGVFLVCSRRMDSVFITNLLAYVF